MCREHSEPRTGRDSVLRARFWGPKKHAMANSCSCNYTCDCLHHDHETQQLSSKLTSWRSLHSPIVERLCFPATDWESIARSISQQVVGVGSPWVRACDKSSWRLAPCLFLVVASWLVPFGRQSSRCSCDRHSTRAKIGIYESKTDIASLHIFIFSSIIFCSIFCTSSSSLASSSSA